MINTSVYRHEMAYLKEKIFIEITLNHENLQIRKTDKISHRLDLLHIPIFFTCENKVMKGNTGKSSLN